MKKLLLSALSIIAGAGIMCAANLFTGEHAVTWENTLKIEPSEFADAQVGDLLTVTIAEGGTDVMELKSAGAWLPGTVFTNVSSKTKVEAYLNEYMLTLLKYNGLELCGPSFTVTSVDINSTDMAIPDGAIWAGWFWIDDNWNTLELFKHSFMFKEVKQIIINFTEEANNSEIELNVLTKWDDADMKISSDENTTISGQQAIIDLTKLPEGRTFESYFEGDNNTLKIQGHVKSGNSFNISSVVLSPYYTASGVESITSDTDKVVDVYSVSGVKLRSCISEQEATVGLLPGLYIVGHKKVIVTE